MTKRLGTVFLKNNINHLTKALLYRSRSSKLELRRKMRRLELRGNSLYPVMRLSALFRSFRGRDHEKGQKRQILVRSRRLGQNFLGRKKPDNQDADHEPQKPLLGRPSPVGPLGSAQCPVAGNK